MILRWTFETKGQQQLFTFRWRLTQRISSAMGTPHNVTCRTDTLVTRFLNRNKLNITICVLLRQLTQADVTKSHKYSLGFPFLIKKKKTSVDVFRSDSMFKSEKEISVKQCDPVSSLNVTAACTSSSSDEGIYFLPERTKYIKTVSDWRPCGCQNKQSARWKWWQRTAK